LKILIIFVEQIKQTMSKEKLLQNQKGEYLYLFNWQGGGFNDVWAPNKKEAYKLVVNERKEWEEKNPTFVKLRPVYDSMRRATFSQYQEQNKLGIMMSI
jgi:hypothetical protein